MRTDIQPQAAGYVEVEVFLVLGAEFIPAKVVMVQYIPIDGLMKEKNPGSFSIDRNFLLFAPPTSSIIY